jgi:hypothetical protein
MKDFPARSTKTFNSSALHQFDEYLCQNSIRSPLNSVVDLATDTAKATASISMQSAYGFLASYIKYRCKEDGQLIEFDGKNQPKLPSCKRFAYQSIPHDGKVSLHTPSEYANEVDQVLSNNKPVGVAYCASTLEQSGNRSYIKSRDFPAEIQSLPDYDYSKNYDKNCGFHESVVIGRQKMQNGSCYYLIENSWGAGSGGYAGDVKVEKGKFWVPQGKLFNNIYNVQSLEN